ncbi:winged helix domain-containing protein [Hwanghaeella sp.]|uniref:winged helix domain-containing protein n=1 Tax=Hwanghaeella sp. TaxID=2605943 RepID=UPI003CCC1A6F
MPKSRIIINLEIDDNPPNPPRIERLEGRFAQTAEALVQNGERGVTALEIATWALRLSHYIYVLRHRYGLVISMEREKHEGPYAGEHGRYRLHTPCRIIRDQGMAA